MPQASLTVINSHHPAFPCGNASGDALPRFRRPSRRTLRLTRGARGGRPSRRPSPGGRIHQKRLQRAPESRFLLHTALRRRCCIAPKGPFTPSDSVKRPFVRSRSGLFPFRKEYFLIISIYNKNFAPNALVQTAKSVFPRLKKENIGMLCECESPPHGISPGGGFFVSSVHGLRLYGRPFGFPIPFLCIF